MPKLKRHNVKRKYLIDKYLVPPVSNSMRKLIWFVEGLHAGNKCLVSEKKRDAWNHESSKDTPVLNLSSLIIRFGFVQELFSVVIAPCELQRVRQDVVFSCVSGAHSFVMDHSLFTARQSDQHRQLALMNCHVHKHPNHDETFAFAPFCTIFNLWLFAGAHLSWLHAFLA